MSGNKSTKTAVLPGTFDPFTRGHQYLVERGLRIFDLVVVAIGVNAEKKTMFSLDERIRNIETVFAGLDRVSVKSYEGLTVSFCKQQHAQFIIRGIRSAVDMEYERTIDQVNFDLNADIQTVYLMAPPELSAINSTIVRDIIRYGGDASKYLPAIPPEKGA